MKKICLLFIVTSMSLVAVAKEIICAYSDIPQLKNSPLVIVNTSVDTFNIYEGSTFSGDQEITFEGERLFLRLKDENIKKSSDSLEILTLSNNWGSRFALTGYYGTRTVSVNLLTGEGEYRNHVIPHLIADINAPQSEHTDVRKLLCK